MVKRSGWALLRASHAVRERRHEVPQVELEVEFGVGRGHIYHIAEKTNKLLKILTTEGAELVSS